MIAAVYSALRCCWPSGYLGSASPGQVWSFGPTPSSISPFDAREFAQYSKKGTRVGGSGRVAGVERGAANSWGLLKKSEWVFDLAAGCGRDWFDGNAIAVLVE